MTEPARTFRLTPVFRLALVASLVAALALPAVPPPVAGQPAADVTFEDVYTRSLDVAVTINPVALRIEQTGSEFRVLSRGSLRGRARLGFEITAEQPLGTIRMDFDGELTVRSVSTDSGQVTFTRSGDQLTLQFSPPLPPGARPTVTVEYDGSTFFVYNEFVLVHPGVLYPVLISPFGDRSPNMARATLEVTAPPGFAVVSTGRQTAAGPNTLRFDTEVAVPWVAIAGGRRHRRVERMAGGIRLVMVAPPGEDRNLDKLATYTGQAIEFYGRVLYPFPHSEVKVVSLFIVGGGIGYPGFLLIDDRAFAGRFTGASNRDSFLFQLMAHEVAHSYVPGRTVPRGVGWIWLSEGFAEYLSLMALEAVMGPQAYARELQDARDSYAALAGSSLDRPISVYTFANYGSAASRRVIYGKGCLVLHMLRFVIGDEAFRHTLAAYFQRYRGRPARVDDFRAVAEEVSGQPLEWFFDQWVTQVVLPDYQVASASSVRDGEQFRTTATIRNAGTGAMPVEVAFISGEQRVVQRVDMPGRGERSVTAHTAAAVTRVEVDPGKWLIQSNYRNDTFDIR